MDNETQGHVYLLHYIRPMHHAQHYLGWTNDLKKRMLCHVRGEREVCVITSEFAKKDIPFILVRLWTGPLSVEKRLKKLKNSRRFCPLCQSKISGKNAAFVESLSKIASVL